MVQSQLQQIKNKYVYVYRCCNIKQNTEVATNKNLTFLPLYSYTCHLHNLNNEKLKTVFKSQLKCLHNEGGERGVSHQHSPPSKFPTILSFLQNTVFCSRNV